MERSWCQTCQYEAKAETIEELMRIWDIHTETDEHIVNVINRLMKDTSAKTLEELPEKFHEHIEKLLKQRHTYE